MPFQRTALLSLFLLSLWLSTTTGQNVDYVRTVPGGLFRAPQLWSPFNPVPPFLFGPGGATDRAHFNLGFQSSTPYTITDVFGVNQQLLVENDSVRLLITDFQLDGTISNSIAGIVVGNHPGDVGTAIFSGGAGSQLLSVNTRLGTVPGSTGLIIVDGQGLNWTNFQNLFIGSPGSGNFTLLDGAVSTQNCSVGNGTATHGLRIEFAL